MPSFRAFRVASFPSRATLTWLRILIGCAAGAWMWMGAAAPAWALDPDIALADYNRRNHTVTDGLPHAHVMAIAQTDDGYLWLGTESGLVRFDGAAFSLPQGGNADLVRARGVWRLDVDAGGSLFIMGNGETGLTRFDGESFAVMHPGIDPGLHVFARDRAGTLFVGGGHGLGRMRGDTALPPLSGADDPGDVRALSTAPDGSVWIGSVEHGLLHLVDGKPVSVLPAGTNLGGRISSLAIDVEGGVWIGTTAGGLHHWRNNRLATWTTREGLSSNAVRGLLIDRDGSLWIGTRGGLDRMQLRDTGANLESLRRDTGLPDNLISALFEDREGNVWVGTRNGLLRLNEGRFAPLKVPDAPELTGEGFASATLQTRDGAVWIGTTQGLLLRYHEGKWQRYTRTEGLCVFQVLALAEDTAGRLWIGGTLYDAAAAADGTGFPVPLAVDKRAPSSPTPLCVFSDGRFTKHATDAIEGGEVVRALAPDPAGFVWVGAAQVLRIDGDVVTPMNNPSPHRWIYALAADGQGGVWVGTTGAVLHRQADGQWQRHPIATVGFGVVSLGPHAAWFGTARGLVLWKDNALYSYAADQGFVDDPIVQTVMDRAGNLWACSPRGVLRVLAADLVRQEGRARWEAPLLRYTAEDGMGAAHCESASSASNAFVDQDGRPAFLTSQVLLRVRTRTPRPATTFDPIIERLTVDGHERDIHGSIVIPPGTGDARIDYTAPAFIGPHRLHFRYRLSPFDRDWVMAGARRNAYYTHLPPGRYHFEVVVRDDDGTWGQRPARLDFLVQPRFFQTGWFRGLMGLVLLLLGVLAYRLRVRQIAAHHAVVLAERSRIARDIHDTLAQGFTAISIHAEAALGAIDDAPDVARDSLKQVREVSKASLQEAHQVVWDLRAGALASGGLSEALGKVVGQVNHTTDVRLSTTGSPRTIPFTHESALLRVGQEAITNALRHAQAKRIDVEVIYGPAEVGVRVTDDGVGFDMQVAAEKVGHFGLVGMQERVSALAGRWTGSSRPGRTEIVAILPTREY